MNEDRIRQHLADKAAGIEVSPGNPDDLKSRSANPLVVMGAGLALVTLFGLGLAWLLPASEPDLVASETTSAESNEVVTDQGSSSSGQGSVRAPAIWSNLPAIAAGNGPTLTWQGGEFPGGTWVNGIVSYGDGFLAWGQESISDYEGDYRPRLLLWTSDDGLAWTEIAVSNPVGAYDTFWVSTLLATDDRLVAVGTAWDPPPGEGVDGRFEQPGTEHTFLLTSVDGVSWESTELGAQVSGPTGNPGEFWWSSEPMLAARGDLVVLLSTKTLSFDPYLIIEEKMADVGLEVYGFGSDDTGLIEVYGPSDGGKDEVIATFTAEELGIDPEYFKNGDQGPLETRSSAFVSTDGGASFRSMETAGLDDIGYLNAIVTTANGFVLSGEEAYRSGSWQGQASWTSSDGVNWTKGDPIGDGYFNSLDGHGSFIVGAGDNLIVSFDDGATFNRVEGPAFDAVDGLDFYVEQAKTGAFGTIAIGSAWNPGQPQPPLEVEVDGKIYRESYDDCNGGAASTADCRGYADGPTVTVTDAATGEVLFSKANFWQPEYMTYGDDGAESMSFISPETGEVLFTASWMEFDGGPSGPRTTTIERDGLSFTIEFAEERGPSVVIVDMASGEVLFDVDDVLTPSYIVQDPEGYTILDLDTGDPVIRIDYMALEQAYSTMELEVTSQEPVMALWFSPDGESWSRQSMAEAFGESGYPQAMASGTDRVIVTFQPATDFYPQNEEEARTYVPPPTQVWVGTLP